MSCVIGEYAFGFPAYRRPEGYVSQDHLVGEFLRGSRERKTKKRRGRTPLGS